MFSTAAATAVLCLDEGASSLTFSTVLLDAPLVTVADVSNLNAIIDDTPELEDLSLYDIMLTTDGTTFNNAAQVSRCTVMPT